MKQQQHLHIPTSLLSTHPRVATTRAFSTSRRLHRSTRKPSPSNLTHLKPSGEAHMVHIPPPSRPTTSSSPSTTTISDTSAESIPSFKPPTARLATARANVVFSNPAPSTLIRSANLKKGDVLSVARIAGIMAAKRTADLIPLCHNIPLSGVEVRVELRDATHTPASTVSESGFETESPSVPESKLQSQSQAQPQSESQSESDSESSNPDDTTLSTVKATTKCDHELIGPHGGITVTATVRTFGQTGVEMEALVAVSAAALTVYDMCKGVDRGMRVEGMRVVLKEGGRSGTWREGEQELE